jgi:hypothetical protein
MQLLLKSSQSEGTLKEPHEPNRCRFFACD